MKIQLFAKRNSTLAMGQSGKQPKQLVNIPIVSDKEMPKDKPIRVVPKDEFQRIINDMKLEMHDLEKRIEILEARGR